MTRTAEETRLPGIFGVHLFLFLPLYAILVAAHRFHFDLGYLREAPASFFYLTLCLPALQRHLDYAVCQELLWAGALLTLLFYWCPGRFKKTLLTAFALAYIGYILGFVCLLLYCAALLMLWSVRRHDNASTAKWIAVLCGLALSWFGSLAIGDAKTYFAWGLSFFLTLKSFSYFIDTAACAEKHAFPDFALYMTSGFPCPFATPWYTFSEFSRSYREGGYWETAKGGIIGVYLGLSKLAAAFACELIVSPRFSPFHLQQMVDRPYFSGAELWVAGITGYFLYLVRFVGCYQVMQGLTRLFGYDVQDQFRKPWSASTPLDFWRRFSVHNRVYLIKYIFYPVFRRWRNPYMSLLAVFSAAAVINIFMHQPTHLAAAKKAVPWAGEWAVSFCVFYAFFALLCLLESLVLRRGRFDAALLAAPQRTARWKILKIGITLFLLILIVTPANTFRIYDPPPNLIHGRTLRERYLFIYKSMLFPFSPGTLKKAFPARGRAARIPIDDPAALLKRARALLSSHPPDRATRFDRAAKSIALAQDALALGGGGRLILAEAYCRMSPLAPDSQQASRWLDLAEREVAAAERFQKARKSQYDFSSDIKAARERLGKSRLQVARR